MFNLSRTPYIIKETNDLYFIYKPDGYTSDKTYNEIQNYTNKSIINYIRNNLIVSKDLKNATYTFGQMHRLDYGTNGTMIIAKNLKAYKMIKDSMENKKTKKIYIALVSGDLTKKHDFIMINMKKIMDNDKYTVEFTDDNNDGTSTLSEYHVWKTFRNKLDNKMYNLVFVRIYSGFTHQIRIHMKSIGHPLVNDYLYCDIDDKINDGKIFLLSYLYCIKKIGCSIDYKIEPNFNLNNMEIQNKYDYITIINNLLKKNDERKNIIHIHEKKLKKENKKLSYYISTKNDYKIVNIPGGKINKLDIKFDCDCLIDNKLHTVAIIDSKEKINYVYYFLVRNHIENKSNKYYDIKPIYHISLTQNNKTFYFSQIIVTLKKKFANFDELKNVMYDYDDIIFVRDKKYGKNEMEFIVFRHYHNYVLPIVDGKILHKFWIKNLKKQKYKYDNKLKFTKV